MKKIFPSQINLNSNISSIDIFIKGKSFLKTRKLYLSAYDEMMFDGISTFDPFSMGTDTQKESYPAFRGIEIQSFDIVDDKFLIFNLPLQPKTDGYIDIILENEAGYGKLIKDTIFSKITGVFYDDKNFLNNGINIKYYDNIWNDCLIWIDDCIWNEI